MKRERTSNKSQVTLFVIVAIILVVIILIGVYVINNLNKTEGVSPKTTLSEASTILQQARDKCINDISIKALDDYGLDATNVKMRLDSDFTNCMNPLLTQYQKVLDIKSSLNPITCSVDAKEIKIDVDYTLKITKENQTQEIKSQPLIFQRLISKTVKYDSNCIVSEDVGLVSFDDKFDILLFKGTKAQNSDGSCLESITLRLNDPKIDYGGREKGYTSMDYLPGPVGAQFDKEVRLRLKYTAQDYLDYSDAAIKAKSYVIPENWMKMQYYDPSSNNFYVYPSTSNVTFDTNINKRIISAQVNQFLNGNLIMGNDCITKRAVTVESPDKRMRIPITNNMKITDSYGGCVKDITIVNLTRSSVSTFGAGDYGFWPLGAQFSPSIELIYRYTQVEASDPGFLYGRYNWKGLVNGTWTQPDQTQMASSNVSARREIDLRLAFLDNGVFNPYPTQVDTIKKEVIGTVNKFPGTTPAPSMNTITGNVFVVDDMFNDYVVKNIVNSFGGSGGSGGGATNRIATKTNCEDAAYGRWKDVASLAGSNPGTFSFTLTKEYSCAHTAIVNYEVTSDGDSAIADPAELPKTYYPNELGGEHSFSITVSDDNIDGKATADAYVEIWGGGLSTPNGGFEELTDGQYCWYYPNANKCGGEWSEAYCMTAYSGLELEGCLACVRMAAAEGNPEGKTLDYCTHAVIGEGGTALVSYQAASCSAAGNFKSSAGLVGYNVGDWYKVNSSELARQMSAAGLTVAGIELNIDPYDSQRNSAYLMPKLVVYVNAMRAKNITTFINIVLGKYRDGENYVCAKEAYNNQFFTDTLNYINTNIGSDKVILQPTSEWMSCTNKRDAWVNIFKNSNWSGGRSIYNVASGPNYYLEHHPAPGEVFPSGALVTMDGGDILKMTSTINRDGGVSAVPEKLEAYAKSVIACGSGIIYYGYGQTSIDSGAIQAMGRAKAG